MTGFWAIHSGLPREGPGLPEDVAWALDVADTPAEARICDAGCGPGADLETFARLRPRARLTGIEAHGPFAAAARARVPSADVWEGDMRDPGGPYDLIWCAGALYFLGVTEGLIGWRDALAPGGRVAFSEPCLPDGPAPRADAFWADYPAATDAAGIACRIEAAGWRICATRLIAGGAWEAYYTPMQRRIDALRGDPSLGAAIEAEEREIALWRAAPDEIAYLLCIVAPE